MHKEYIVLAIDQLISVCIMSNRINTKLEEIQEIIHQNDNQFSLITDFNGRTPLHFLATRNNVEAFDYLLTTIPGLDINHKDDMGWTALSNACYLGSLEMIKYLLEKGASANVIDFGGKTLLHLVGGNEKMSSEDKSLAIQLFQGKINPEIQDIRSQTYENILHFDRKRDLENMGVDPFGRSILHWAAYLFDEYKDIYESRMDLISVTDDTGRTALIYAVYTPKPVMPYIHRLINTGSMVDHSDKGGKTAIHFAARMGSVEVIELLLENGANPLLPDKMGQTAEDIAERYSPQLLPILQKAEVKNTW